ncbi:neuromedin-U receptor 1 [Biomphalaria glabrata]
MSNVSGVLYFLSCTVNPILYNLLSRKFRQAFKRTLCRCCFKLDSHSIPAFYKLKAKFVGTERRSPGLNNSNTCYLYPDNGIRLAKFTENDARKGLRHLPYGYAHPSTNETSLKNSSPTAAGGNSSGAHAHSDGRLHRICRHKYCSTRRAGMSPTGSTGPQVLATPNARTIISYPDILCHTRHSLNEPSVLVKERVSKSESVSHIFKSNVKVSW